MEQTIVIPNENVEIYDVVEEINHEHELCIGSMRDSLEHAIRAGELLVEQKEKLQQGEWMIWVKMNCSFSHRTATNYMKVASNWQSNANLKNANDIKHALRIIAAEDPKPKPAELPQPEDKKYFSWFDDERVTETYDNIKKMVAAVSLLKTSKEDRGAAEQILKQWDTALNKVIDKIRE